MQGAPPVPVSRFTRDPGSGEPILYLDFTFNAQGEDIVSGRRNAPDATRLATVLPQAYTEIVNVAGRLEAEFRDMQEFEFTIQDGRLFILQTRTGKRMPWAALRIAVDMVDEDRVSEAEALEHLHGIDLERIARRKVVHGDSARVLCRATPAGLGVAIGEIALDAERAATVAAAGRSAILVPNRRRPRTSPASRRRSAFLRRPAGARRTRRSSRGSSTRFAWSAAARWRLTCKAVAATLPATGSPRATSSRSTATAGTCSRA